MQDEASNEIKPTYLDKHSERQELFCEINMAEKVGEKLTFLRQKKGLSQRELARRAGITNSTLSTIEQGKASPSIVSLEKILKAVPISFEEFFSSSEKIQDDVFKADSLTKIDVSGASISLLSLTDTNFDGCYLAKKVLAPGADTTFDWLNRGGNIAAFVVSGSLTLTIEGQPFVLGNGDGLHFDITRKHKLQNVSTQPCVLVCSSLPQ